MRPALAAAALAAGLATASPGEAAVWDAQNAWNDQWEDRYVEWVRTEFDKDEFHNPDEQTIFGLALDCADAIYAMRILFAWQNSLPFEINNPPDGRILSNETTKWDGFRETRRHENDDGTWSTYKGPEYGEPEKVRAFIEHVSDITSTLNLVNDTYPVPLSDVRPGDMFLLPRNHAYIVKDIDPTGAMTTLSHSSPRAWRVMAQIFDFPAEVPSDPRKRDGYRRFKPAKYLRTNPENVPGASTEQWEVAARLGGDREAFALSTQNALASIKEPVGQKAERLFGSLCDYTGQRVDIVNHAISELDRMEAQGQRRCMGLYQYGEHSTPSRDRKLTGQFRVLKALTSDPEWASSQFPLKSVIEATFDPANGMSDQELGAYCAIPFDVRGGRRITLREVWRGIEAGRLVSDPHAPLDARWGLVPGGYASSCPSSNRS